MGGGAAKKKKTDARAAEHAAPAAPARKRIDSLVEDLSMSELGAVRLIQRWYRRKMAELELRRNACWQVFTDIEYQSEQEQLGLTSFFSDLELLQQALQDKSRSSTKRKLAEHATGGNEVAAIKVVTLIQSQEHHYTTSHETEDKLFDRPNLPSNLTPEVMKLLIKGCQDGSIINYKLAMSILDEAFQMQKKFPNIRPADTATTHKITVVGDLHGKLIDLLLIFEKNGVPSDSNPYIINGDLVDRGRHGVEICIVMFGFQLLYPYSVYITRGNHEDYLMNKR